MRHAPIAAGLAFSIGLASLAAAADSPAAGAAATGTVPASVATTHPSESVADLVASLADPDPAARDHASKGLWELGREAEPALREAAAGAGNPEIARRARAILRDFAYGLYPDAPREVFELLDEYRKGSPADKRNAITGLTTHGVPGLRVLLKLREDERDAAWKQTISQALAPREHEVSVLMLANGQADEVERMLEHSAADSPVAAQDYAALLYFNGKLKQTFAKLNATSGDATVLVALARAAGDGAAARMAAERSRNADLLDAVLTEQGDWRTLSARAGVASDAERFQPAEQAAFQCAYARMLGDTAAANAAAAKLADRAQQAPQDYQTCAEDLFLNDRPDAATSILLQNHDYLLASEFLATRLQFNDALDLPHLAAQNQPSEAIKVKARTVGTMLFVGDIDGAKRLTNEVIAENSLRHDFATWVYLVEAAREAGQTDRMNEFAAHALATATRDDPIAWLFQKMHLGDGSAATLWWQFIQVDMNDKPAAAKLTRLRQILEGSLPVKDWDTLSESARRYGADMPAAERVGWQQTVADALAAANRDDLAVQWTARLEESGEPAALVHAGDFHADHNDWPAAARDYNQAWEHDRTRADALYLFGWALSKTGKATEGTARMAQAVELPLGNETGRLELAQALGRHKLTAAADKQYDLILTLTAPRSWERNEALRRSAEDLAAAGDDLAAADRWEKAFLPNLTNNTSFIEPWANVVVPALVHKTRALGLIKAGRIEAAMENARIAMDDAPSDADTLIDIVTALDAAGRRPQADAFYAKYTESYRKLVAAYPNSGPLHNQLSWAQVMCHRELDDALKNGLRAVELEPNSTASRDTLAEVYFARGDAKDAVAQMQKCVELEPRIERHRKQLARFQAATTQPAR